MIAFLIDLGIDLIVREELLNIDHRSGGIDRDQQPRNDEKCQYAKGNERQHGKHFAWFKSASKGTHFPSAGT